MVSLSILDVLMATHLSPLTAPIRALLSLLLATGIGLLGVGVGKRVLAWLRIKPATSGERLVLAAGLGLGTLGYGFLALGLVGLLHPVAIGAMLALAAVLAWPQMRRWTFSWRKTKDALRPPGFFEQLGATLIIAMLAVVLLRGLAPVTDYDGLAYHLVVPRQYLEAGRLFPQPGDAHANFPLTVDLLYIPAILLKLENTARLMHMGFGILLGLGVYTLARRLFGTRRGGWLALFVFCTTAVIGTVGGYAHTDLGWALFQFLAVYGFLCWAEEGEKAWLILTGIFAGLGLGSKYLGLPALGVLGLAVLVQSSLLNRQPWRSVLGNALLFGLVALVVASPWYLKNWLWLGNPVYPLWFGGLGWDAFLSAKLQFMGTNYGPRRGILGFLLLPWDIFSHSVGFFGPIPFAFPTPLSLLLPLYLFVRRRTAISMILLIALLRFVIWAFSARNARYLMDVYPLLSIAVAYLLIELARRRMVWALLRGLVLVLMVANLAWQVLLLGQEGPISVVLGLESCEDYLAEHNHPPYRVIRFINDLPTGSKVLFAGNGQSYYVTTNHIADVNHSNWGHLIYKYGEDPTRLYQALGDQGVTHIYYSGYDFAWQLNFDFDGRLAKELELFDQFSARCARLIYDEGENGQVYALLDGCK